MLVTEETRIRSSRHSKRRRAAVQRAASSLTSSMVCSRVITSSSFSGPIFLDHGRSGNIPMGMEQHAAHFFGQLFHAKGFRNVRQVIAREELLGGGSDDVAGDKEKALGEGAPSAGQAVVKMLAIDSGHCHIANHQIKSFAARALQRFAAVENYVHAK